jgi:hypothetical protein
VFILTRRCGGGAKWFPEGILTVTKVPLMGEVDACPTGIWEGQAHFEFCSLGTPTVQCTQSYFPLTTTLTTRTWTLTATTQETWGVRDHHTRIVALKNCSAK